MSVLLTCYDSRRLVAGLQGCLGDAVCLKQLYYLL
jgi:hypothetical protein